jgi:hypothetical protein
VFDVGEQLALGFGDGDGVAGGDFGFGAGLLEGSLGFGGEELLVGDGLLVAGGDGVADAGGGGVVFVVAAVATGLEANGGLLVDAVLKDLGLLVLGAAVAVRC